MEGSEQAVADYHGQYMFQYAWAEETHAQIEKRVRSWEMLKKIRKPSNYENEPIRFQYKHQNDRKS